MISCLTNSTEVALALAAPLIIPLLLFGGFFLQNGAVPVYFDWMRYISWFMYGNEALSINQWVGVEFQDAACPGGNCTGEAILARFDFNPVLGTTYYNYLIAKVNHTVFLGLFLSRYRRTFCFNRWIPYTSLFGLARQDLSQKLIKLCGQFICGLTKRRFLGIKFFEMILSTLSLII